MLRFPCLVLDHDDTVVQSEATVNYPFFCRIMAQMRPGETVTLQEYANGCCHLGFSEMCRKCYHFTEQELQEEYRLWQEYIIDHAPLPFPGMAEIIRRQKEAGGRIFVVSHSGIMNITRDYLQNFSILPDKIYGWDLPEKLRKPSPYSLLDIQKEYGYRPEEMLVVDDMKPAWEMAHAVGVAMGFAAWSRQDCPDILQELTGLADYTFPTVEALRSFLFDPAE